MFRNRNEIRVAAVANRNQHIAHETVAPNAFHR